MHSVLDVHSLNLPGSNENLIYYVPTGYAPEGCIYYTLLLHLCGHFSELNVLLPFQIALLILEL